MGKILKLKKGRNMEITKSNSEVYKIKSSETWANITIESLGKKGYISIQSDYGNWSNYWGSCGDSFKKFLTSLNIDYFAGKVGEDNFIDVEGSLKNMYHTISKAYLDNEIESDVLEDIKKEISILEGCRSENFDSELWHCENIVDFFDSDPPYIKCVSPRFNSFWEKVWMPFCEYLKSENKFLRLNSLVMTAYNFISKLKDFFERNDEGYDEFSLIYDDIDIDVLKKVFGDNFEIAKVYEEEIIDGEECIYVYHIKPYDIYIAFKWYSYLWKDDYLEEIFEVKPEQVSVTRYKRV